MRNSSLRSQQSSSRGSVTKLALVAFATAVNAALLLLAGLLFSRLPRPSEEQMLLVFLVIAVIIYVVFAAALWFAPSAAHHGWRRVRHVLFESLVVTILFFVCSSSCQHVSRDSMGI